MSAINGKVDIAQGASNAGKVLGINASGNVEPTEISSGGEVWEEVDLNNFPTNWVNGDRIRVVFKLTISSSVNSWNGSLSDPTISINNNGLFSSPIEVTVYSSGEYFCDTPFYFDSNGYYVRALTLEKTKYVDNMNRYGELFSIRGIVFNQSGCKITYYNAKKDSIAKMWRLKK